MDCLELPGDPLGPFLGPVRLSGRPIPAMFWEGRPPRDIQNMAGTRRSKKRQPRGPRKAPRQPGRAPRWPKRAQEGPRWPQDGPKMGPRGPKTGPRGPKMAPRWAQDGPKIGPRWAQERSKKGPRWAKMGPRWAKMGPNRLQDRRICNQDGQVNARKGRKQKCSKT